MPRNPEHYIADALLMGSIGLKEWQQGHGCEERCDCACCLPLNAGLKKLNEALEEMKAAGE